MLVDGVEIDRKGIGGFFGEAALVLKQARIADVRSCGAKVYKDHGLPEAAELFRLHRYRSALRRDLDQSPASARPISLLAPRARATEPAFLSLLCLPAQRPLLPLHPRASPIFAPTFSASCICSPRRG